MANDFLPFGTGGSANVLSQSAWASLPTRGTGFQSGVADSQACNKAWRQSSVMAAAIGKIVDDAGGNALDDGNVAALANAIVQALRIGPRGSQAFIVSANFTVPENVFRVRVRLWGGGGGGGGALNVGASASGGAGGGYAEGTYAVTPGAVIAVTIGAAGTAGLAGGANGGTGGTSSFGAFASAPGGTGGLSVTSGQAAGSAAGPVPSGGTLNRAGQPTAVAYLVGTTALASGGGAAPFGGAGTGPSVAAGLVGGFPGGGGGGGANGFNGATGQGGLCIVEW